MNKLWQQRLAKSKMQDRVEDVESWPLPHWTSAPLRLESVTLLAASPGVLFNCLTNPIEMCSLFSWMHEITVDNAHAIEPNGLGAKRRCHFGNGMILEEVIVGWQPPQRYAYQGIEETHPFGMRGHLGIIRFLPEGSGTRLIWEHYFDHLNPAAMVGQLSASVQMVLQCMSQRFGEIVPRLS